MLDGCVWVSTVNLRDIGTVQSICHHGVIDVQSECAPGISNLSRLEIDLLHPKCYAYSDMLTLVAVCIITDNDTFVEINELSDKSKCLWRCCSNSGL